MISSRRICVSILVGMLVGNICWLGQPLPLRAEAVDKLLPAETQMVMHLDMRQLQKSQLFKKHVQKPLREALKENEELKQLQEATGLDFLKDIHNVTVALTKLKIDITNPRNVDPNSAELFVIVRGDFARDPLVKVMKKNEDLESRRYQGYDIFITKEDDDGQRAYICVADDGLILASNQRSRLQKSLDTLQGSQPANVNKSLRTAIEGVPAGQTLWLAMGEIPLLKELAKQNDEAADALEKLVGLSLTIGVSDRVSVAVRAHGKDQDTAREFRAGFEKIRGFLAFFAAQDPNFGPIVQDILNTVKTAAKDTTATLEFELTEETIQKIVKVIQAMLGGAVNRDD